MPTDNPRINVTLSPTLFALVGRLAALERVSKANVLRELLEASAPALGRAVALMEAASKAKPEMLRGMALAMERAQGRVEGIMEGLMDEAGPDLVEQAEAIKARRPGRAGASADGRQGRSGSENPPASNRGVKYPQNTDNAASLGPKASALRATKGGQARALRTPKGGAQ